MAQITEAQRIQRIKDLQTELNKLPPQKHETKQIMLDDGPKFCDVISLPAEEVLLNPRSHRIRSQLDDDPRWPALLNDPFSEPAQKLLEELVRSARSQDELDQLAASLLEDGQADPGVITHKGVLVNANTRAVVMRCFDKPNKRILRVAVLPPTVQEKELGLLELRLQMQKELKVEYSLTNELLFIEELAHDYGMSYEAIASELRIEVGNAKKGAREVELRLTLLDLLRILQQIPTNKFPLREFDELGGNGLALQQLKEVYLAHAALLERGDAAGAQRYLETFLVSALAGVTSVHAIRLVDNDFVGDYVVPQLEDDDDDDDVGRFAKDFLNADSPTPAPTGAGALLGGDDGADDVGVSVKGLIDAMTDKHSMVQVPGTPVKVEREALLQATQAAFKQGIKEKRRDQRVTTQIEAPIEAVRAATRELKQAQEMLKSIDAPDFDAAHRKTLEAACKTFRRAFRSWETAATKVGMLKGQ